MTSCDVSIVGGLGHVGLPLGIALAQAGLRVVLCDIDEGALKTVSAGSMPFMEKGGEEALRSVNGTRLTMCLGDEAVRDSHYVIVALGTPIDEHLNPDYGGLMRFFERIEPRLRADQHVILRSTVLPGTTDKVKQMLQGRGKDLMVSFCPERIAEGRALEELRKLPQLIGAADEASAKDAAALFSVLTDQVVVLSPREAELAKLFTNSLRYIQFAISNQFYQIAVQNRVDFHRIYRAATWNYPRAQAWTPAGFAAGPCLFKDTMQLASYANNTFFLGHAAMLVNEGLPNFIVMQLKQRFKLDELVVAILGMAFKADHDDIRESLSYKMKKLLRIEAKEVLCTDPFVADEFLVPLETAIERADILIIGVPHSIYRSLEGLCDSKVVVDVWNLFKGRGLF